MNNAAKILVALLAIHVGVSAGETAFREVPPPVRAATPRGGKPPPAILLGGKKANIGVIAADARFSNFGAYLQRMVEAIQLQWDGEVAAAKLRNVGGHVVVAIHLDAAGRATIKRVENHSADAAARACTAAILNRAPFGAWSDDMKRTLGDPQQLMFTFYFD